MRERGSGKRRDVDLDGRGGLRLTADNGEWVVKRSALISGVLHTATELAAIMNAAWEDPAT